MNTEWNLACTEGGKERKEGEIRGIFLLVNLSKYIIFHKGK